MIRAGSIWSEALRDITSGTTRTLLFAVFATLLISALTVADAVTVGALVRDAREFQRRGAAVITLTAPQGIDGRACERLADLPGASSAGALRISTADLTAELLRESPIPIFEVSTQFLDVVGSTRSAGAGVSVPTDVTSAFSAHAGDRIITREGSALIAGTYEYPADGRRPGFAWAVLVPGASAGVYDECWVEVWPSNDDLRSLLLGTVPTLEFSAAGKQVLIGQLNTQLGTSFDGYARYAERPSRWVSLVAALIALAIGYLSVRIRRLELAARLHDGMTHTQLALLIVIETASWLVPTALVSAAAGVAYAWFVGPPDATAIAQHALLTAAAALVGGTAGTLSSVLLVRERHLFAYFKDR